MPELQVLHLTIKKQYTVLVFIPLFHEIYYENVLHTNKVIVF